MADPAAVAVLTARSGAVAWITLNRPQAMNSINEEVRTQLPAALRAADADPVVRVIVINGAGERAFCAGADIKGFIEAPTPAKFRQARLQGHWIDVRCDEEAAHRVDPRLLSRRRARNSARVRHPHCRGRCDVRAA